GPRKADQLAREIERQAQIAVARVEPGFAHPRVGDALVGPAPDNAGERGDDILRQSKRLPDLADRAAGAIADDGRGDAGAVAAVFVVDVLDDLLAPLMLEIDIDVGRLAARGADKALEKDVDLGRIDRGDAEAIADDRIGRRAAALAQDVLAARELDDVVHGEEIAREIELLDQLELVLDPLADVLGNTAGEFLGGALPSQFGQPLLGGEAGRHRLLGIFVAQFVEAEPAARDDFERAGQRVLIAAEQSRHFRRRLQMTLGMRGEAETGLRARAMLAEAGPDLPQGPPLGLVA